MFLGEIIWSSWEFILFISASLIHRQESHIIFTAADAAGTRGPVMAQPISEIKALKLWPAKSSLLLLGNFSAVIPNQKIVNEGKLLTAHRDECDF